jgi:cytochrome c biogenesis protein CcdA
MTLADSIHGVPATSPKEHPLGTASLVLGVLGLVGVPVLAPVAWYLGSKGLAEVDGNVDGASYTNRGNLATGKILGIIGSILWLLAIAAFLFLWLVLGTIVLGSSYTTDVNALAYVLSVFIILMLFAWQLGRD